MVKRKDQYNSTGSSIDAMMETIDETKEATTSSETDQLTQQIQQELEEENRRNDNTLAYFKQRVKEEEERHSKQHRLLEARLLQAITQTEGSAAHSDYWLNNRKIPKKEEPRKPAKEEETLIRSWVKKACTASKK